MQQTLEERVAELEQIIHAQAGIIGRLLEHHNEIKGISHEFISRFDDDDYESTGNILSDAIGLVVEIARVYALNPPLSPVNISKN